MTNPTNYENLRTAVYKVLYPDGVPLEIGCDIVLPDGTPLRLVSIDYIGEISGILPVCVRYLETCSRIESGAISTQDGISIILDGWKDSLAFENLGKPLSIADVLRVLQDKGTVYASYFLHANGWLMWEQTRDGNTAVKQICRFDLSKPLSDPSNDAACGAVLALIENHD